MYLKAALFKIMNNYLLTVFMLVICHVYWSSGRTLGTTETILGTTETNTTLETKETNSTLDILPETVNATHGLDCHYDKCGKLSYSIIKQMFKGLLLTTDEIRDIEITANQNREERFLSHGYTLTTSISEPEASTQSDDGGMCCSSFVQHIANTTLTNIYGQTKSVIHLADANPPSYQYIPHAQCVSQGSCAGTCLIEAKILSILVLDSAQGYKFDLFEIPGYCSCKNVY